MLEKDKEAYRAGGIMAVLGLVAIVFLRDLEAGFFLLGVGVVIMASVSEEFREKLFDFFFSIFKAFWETLSQAVHMLFQ